MVLDHACILRLKQIGFSRIPISFTKDRTAIFGVLLTKSLVGYDVCNETIKEAIMKNHIHVIAPLFFYLTLNLTEVCQAFEDGHCHMGIVCDSVDSARYNGYFAYCVLEKLKQNQEYEPNADEIELLGGQTILGVLTLENVIERIL